MLVKIIQKIHRFIGLSAAILILISTITGFLLIHRKDLSLHEKKIHSGSLLWFYGKPKVHKIGDQVIEEDYPPTWEKWLTELHQGHFFGKPIPFLEDFLVFALILLSSSGYYLWFKVRQFRKQAVSGPSEDNLDYLAIIDSFKKLKGKESEIKERLTDLHGLYEHLYHHLGGKDKAVSPQELYEIEQHIKELDTKTRDIMKKIKRTS